MYTRSFIATRIQVLLFVILLISSFNSFAQSGIISGKITDNGTGMGLPGASIVIDGTTQGSMTDLDGNFKITSVAPGNVRLKISYVGYVTETIENVVVTAGSEKVISLKM